MLAKLREQNADFFAAYDAKRALVTESAAAAAAAVPASSGTEGEDEDDGSDSTYLDDASDDAVVPARGFALPPLLMPTAMMF